LQAAQVFFADMWKAHGYPDISDEGNSISCRHAGPEKLKTRALRYRSSAISAAPSAEAIVRAVPADLDARMKVADLCVTARLHDLARRVYAAVAFYDLQGGRPLHALVAAQALHSLGADVVTLHESLAQLYGAGSPRLGRGGRLAPPDPESPVPPPALVDETDANAAAHAAAEAASSTTSLTDFPSMFPPVPLPRAAAGALRGCRRCACCATCPYGAAVVREGSRAPASSRRSGTLRVLDGRSATRPSWRAWQKRHLRRAGARRCAAALGVGRGRRPGRSTRDGRRRPTRRRR
jgi:hypothetical protein